MIICSRCSKENQKHYKFCLGCGAKLEAPMVSGELGGKPAPAPAVGSAPASIEVANTVAPAVANVVPFPSAPTGPGSANPLAAGDVPFPAAPSGLSRVPGFGGLGGAPTPAPAVRSSAALAATPAPVAAPPPAAEPLAPAAPPVVSGVLNAGPSAGRDMIPCPKCGKPVVATYTFCGACGHRMKSAVGGAAAAAGVQKTMFMASNLAPAAKAAPRGHLTLIRPDGTEGGVHPLHDGENLIGRGQGSLFDADPYLSPRHAEFAFEAEGLVVRDLRSLNGVFIKIMQEERLESGEIFRIGQELLRFDVIAPPAPLEDGTEVIGTPNPGYWGRISVIVGRDVDGPAFPLYDESVVLGRERGDILFPEDGYVSGTHAQITLREGHVFLSDLGSSNGTFFRIRGSRVIPSGSLLLMGQQLFRASYR